MKRQRPWARELDTFARAFSGAFLFGIPLLYTMEMWWIGTYLSPIHILTFVAVAFVANLGLAHFSGFRDHDHGHGADLEQAVEALAVGVVGALVVLLVLDRIDVSDPLPKILGIVALQAVPLSIGATVANALFVERGEAKGERAREKPTAMRALAIDIGATAIGALFICFNIAPTEEVPMLAAQLRGANVIALVLFSLVIGYVIVFESEFGDPAGRAAQPGPFQRPVTETTLSYVVALGVAFVALSLFGQIGPGHAPAEALTRTIVLGLPAMVGGAAGRLAV